MSVRRRLAVVAAAAGVALVGFLIARRAGVGPPSPARTETGPAPAPVSSAVPPAVPGVVPAPLPPPLPPPTATPPPDPVPPALTPVGTTLALEAIGQNEQTRRLFAQLQLLGLSREQRDRVLLILGTQALRPAEESPTLEALRAGGHSRVLSEEEVSRVRDERQQIADRALRSLRPALTAILTPAQLERAFPATSP